MTNPTILALWRKLFSGEINLQEKEMLAKWKEESAKEEELMDLLETAWQEFEPQGRMPAEKADALLFKILHADKMDTRSATVIKYRRLWQRIAVAASIVLLAGAGTWFLIADHSAKTKNHATSVSSDNVKAPSSSKATITLADGKILSLDQAGAGTLAEEANAKLVKDNNGQLMYTAAIKEATEEVQYNTLNNPTGSKVIDIVLADGTHVWLNAGSSLTYPVVFPAHERKVSITGEAYFEVASRASSPFIVIKDMMQVQVLGTRFNVNTYPDEEAMKITLLEGSVKIEHMHKAVILQPGQQAKLMNEISVLNNVDVQAVMAWKNGLFYFGETNIEELMRMIARWYDIEVVYEDTLTDEHFVGQISRQVELSKVLQLLEATGTVKFRMEGKKLFVLKGTH